MVLDRIYGSMAPNTSRRFVGLAILRSRPFRDGYINLTRIPRFKWLPNKGNNKVMAWITWATTFPWVCGWFLVWLVDLTLPYQPPLRNKIRVYNSRALLRVIQCFIRFLNSRPQGELTPYNRPYQPLPRQCGSLSYHGNLSGTRVEATLEWRKYQEVGVVSNPILRGGFIFFIFTPIWGRFPFWLIFFKGIGSTTN